MVEEPYIYQLPNELLFQIAGCLRATDNSAQLPRLQKLCLVSKRLLPIAQAELYASAYLPVTCGCHPCVNAALQLLRTLLQRPDLATKVKTLRFRSVNNPITKLYKEKGFKLKPLRDECLRRLADYGYTPEREYPWRICLTNDVESAYIGVLLTLLPNLETLSFSIKETTSGCPCIEPLSALFGNSLIAQMMLLSLRKTVKHIGLSDIGFLRDVRFRNLKSVNLSSVDWTTLARLQGPRTIRAVKSIEELCVTISIYIMDADRSDERGLSLHSLFEALACNNLKTLRIKLHDDTHGQGGPIDYFCSETLVQSASSVSAKLETLQIDWQGDEDDWDWSLRHCILPIASFGKFPSLKHLKIPQQCLFADDLDDYIELEELPTTLERLDILYPDASALDWVKQFVEAETDSLPNLKVLCLQFRDECLSHLAITVAPQRFWVTLDARGIKCLVEDIDEGERDLAALYWDYKKKVKQTKKAGKSEAENSDENDDSSEDDEGERSSNYEK